MLGEDEKNDHSKKLLKNGKSDQAIEKRLLLGSGETDRRVVLSMLKLIIVVIMRKKVTKLDV